MLRDPAHIATRCYGAAIITSVRISQCWCAGFQYHAEDGQVELFKVRNMRQKAYHLVMELLNG